MVASSFLEPSIRINPFFPVLLLLEYSIAATEKPLQHKAGPLQLSPGPSCGSVTSVPLLAWSCLSFSRVLLSRFLLGVILYMSGDMLSQLGGSTGIGLVGEDRVGRSDIVQRKGWFLPHRTSQFKMSVMPKLVKLPLRQQAGLLGASGLSW